MVAMIIKYKTMEKIKYFTTLEKATDYIVNTSLYNYEEFEELKITETYISRIGTIEINGEKELFKQSRENLINWETE